MRSGVCPKCASTEVYSAYAKSSLDAGLRAGDGPPLLNIHQDTGGLFGDRFTLLDFEAFVCRGCGYLEQYVAESPDLGKVSDSKNWRRVERTG
jgi:predicted nucleic-acid-binding Zn-ribbon protein